MSSTYSDVFKYFKPYDRATAEAYVTHTNQPVIRTSSRPGYYALTYRVHDRVHHSLLRITDEKIECVTEAGHPYASFPSASHLIYHVSPPPVLSPPPIVAVEVTSEDPVCINES